MQQVQDLIDERQVALFDALRELSGLNVSSHIETPQLVVVGEQNAGKSSVLEAISRFPFQVHNEICTRFPIKLILRRSHEEITHLRIEPAAWRSESDQQRLRGFREHLSNLDQFPDRMRMVTEELGGSLSHESKEIFDDTLVVESFGPHFSQLDLVDLPGLFQVATNVQSELSMQKADELVERHVKSKRTLVLLIVSARGDFHTRSCQKTIKRLSVEDKDLPGRVIGVMTNPDRAITVSDSLKVVNGGLYSTGLTHGWIVIRNRDEEERGETLDERDLNEEKFFRDDPDWKHVSPDKRGIKALRTTLKAAFLKHTGDSVPQVINEIRKNIRITEDRLNATSKLRRTHKDRRIYLHKVAREFETVTGEACRGTFQDATCKEIHPLNHDCPACQPFFTPFGEAHHSDDSIGPNLRANIRALSREFANAMCHYGKTIRVKVNHTTHRHIDVLDEVQDGIQCEISRSISPVGSSAPLFFPPKSSENQSSLGEERESSSSLGEESEFSSSCVSTQATQELNFQRLIAIFYDLYDESELLSHEQYVDWVAKEIPRWRGREPQTEASETVYHGLFQHQSKRWEEIASNHLEAVWATVNRFVDLAMARACPDDQVRQALDSRVVKPKLKQLRMKSARNLRVLLGCHARGKTGFYDGFINLEPLSLRAKNLIAPASAEANPHEAQSAEKRGTTASSSGNFGTAATRVADMVVGSLIEQTIRRFTAGILPNDTEKSLIESVKKTLSDAVSSGKAKLNSDPPSGSGQNFTAGITPKELYSVSAARVVEYVDMYYEMSMMSFVGYVNSLVVESGILDELPTAILTQQLVIEELEEKTIDRIAMEPSATVQEREQNEKNLETLKRVHMKLKEFSKQCPSSSAASNGKGGNFSGR